MAHADYPGLNGQIIFTDFSSNPEPIFAINPNGTGLTQLTHPPSGSTGDFQEVWSPDGTQIAFERQRSSGSETGQILVMNANGSNQHNISNNGSFDFGPSWSPDGTKIAFARATTGTPGTSQILVMNADGTGQQNISNDNAIETRPRWSPDGRTILFNVQSRVQAGGGQIWAMNPDGTGKHNLITAQPSNVAVGSPDWSPDSAQITYTYDINGHASGGTGNNASVWVMNANGTNEHEISNTPNDYDYGPAWSPDATQIVYTDEVNDSSPSQIWAMNPDGSGKHAITNGSQDHNFRPDWQALPNVVSSAHVPACSASGAIPVTVGDSTGFHSPPKALHYRVDGGAEQVVATDSSGNANASVPNGTHTLEYWGEDRIGAQQATHNTVSVHVDTVNKCLRAKPKIHVSGVHGGCTRSSFRVTLTTASSGSKPRMTVFLDGHRLRRVTSRHLKLLIGVASLRAGRHHLRIVVTGAGGTTTRRAAFTVCRAAAPRFTG